MGKTCRGSDEIPAPAGFRIGDPQRQRAGGDADRMEKRNPQSCGFVPPDRVECPPDRCGKSAGGLHGQFARAGKARQIRILTRISRSPETETVASKSSFSRVLQRGVRNRLFHVRRCGGGVEINRELVQNQPFRNRKTGPHEVVHRIEHPVRQAGSQPDRLSISREPGSALFRDRTGRPGNPDRERSVPRSSAFSRRSARPRSGIKDRRRFRTIPGFPDSPARDSSQSCLPHRG